MTLTEMEGRYSPANFSEKVIRKGRTDNRTKEKKTVKKNQEKMESSHTAGENLKCCSHLGKQSKEKVPRNPAILFLGICPREKTYIAQNLCTSIVGSADNDYLLSEYL